MLQSDDPVLLSVELDADSQDVVALLTRSQPASEAAAASAGAMAVAQRPLTAPSAKADAGGFKFTMFGKDLTNGVNQDTKVTWLVIGVCITSTTTGATGSHPNYSSAHARLFDYTVHDAWRNGFQCGKLIVTSDLFLPHFGHLIHEILAFKLLFTNPCASLG